MYALMKLSTGVYLSRSIEGRCYRFNNICLIVLEHLRRVQNLSEQKSENQWSVISHRCEPGGGGGSGDMEARDGGGEKFDGKFDETVNYLLCKKQYTLFEMFSTSISWQYSKLLQKE